MGERAMMTLKWAFYDWMGAISVDEIMSNQRLVERLKVVEKVFRRSQ